MYAPCGNDGAGEVISGALTLKITLTLRNNGYHALYRPIAEDLIGEDSGEKFKAVGVAINSETYSGDGGTFSMVWTNHYIGDMGTKLKVFTKVHTTVNANGEVTANFDHSSVDCKFK